MAAKIRVEWVILGRHPSSDKTATGVIKSIHGNAATVAVSAVASAALNAPVVPLQTHDRLMARLTAVEGDVVATWGATPAATQENGILIRTDGPPEVVPVDPGQALSFIEYAG